VWRGADQVVYLYARYVLRKRAFRRNEGFSERKEGGSEGERKKRDLGRARKGIDFSTTKPRKSFWGSWIGGRP